MLVQHRFPSSPSQSTDRFPLTPPPRKKKVAAILENIKGDSHKQYYQCGNSKQQLTGARPLRQILLILPRTSLKDSNRAKSMHHKTKVSCCQAPAVLLEVLLSSILLVYEALIKFNAYLA